MTRRWYLTRFMTQFGLIIKPYCLLFVIISSRIISWIGGKGNEFATRTPQMKKKEKATKSHTLTILHYFLWCSSAAAPGLRKNKSSFTFIPEAMPGGGKRKIAV